MKMYQPGDEIPPSEPFAFITASGGHYLFKRNSIFEACVRTDQLPGLEEQKEFFHLKTPLMPLILFRQALAFMEAVYEKHRSEAMLLLTFDDGQWGLHVPKQTVSRAGIKYENNEHCRAVGSIHSHPDMHHHPSATDEHDECDFDGIHLIVSSFDPAPSSTACFAVVNGKRFELDPGVVIEGMGREKIDIPAEWLSKVSTGEDKQRYTRGYPYDNGIFDRLGADDVVRPTEEAIDYMEELKEMDALEAETEREYLKERGLA
ncbi:MAG: Mov34/MPN/PAD-1 family protein [Planctomycetaceae bacterium]|nr:Mov34/MPN/PAD-1 family protein [Planctomycetaceae bacterium]